MKRRKKHEEHVDEAWLLPYSDMLTLLLALFIVMFAMAKSDDKRLDQLGEQFHIILSGNSASGKGGLLPDNPATQKTDAEAIAETGAKIKEDLTTDGHKDEVDVKVEKDGVRVTIDSGLLFSPGSATLNSAVDEPLKKVADSLKKIDNDIIVAGYTDNVPNQTKEFKSNWELSAARAISVMDSLVANKGVTENRVSIQAYGEFRPKVPNNSAENRAKNRRVEIFIVKKDK
ncbi:hypothetical protein CBF34_01205 [Vagococcus penaei]|uniref:OmpA/MotB family protein n=1 Tax=Vagococcus penaei TaxID=633807 RepID=UPI000F886F6D|nr:flagellar motor protein MotB [Vagococcus penaei]RSU06730.1 hypothetical protein CBF34_01205 [Vagococcus penaei]